MPVEILPAILAKDEKDFRHKIEAVTDLCQTVQIDVMDGGFVPEKTWAEPSYFDRHPLPMDFEVHLMVADPEAHLEGWSRVGCLRAIIHAEAVDDLVAALKHVRMYGMEAGIAINPETPVEKIESAIEHVDVVQVMGVTPGAMGRAFQPIAIEKVAALRETYPDLLIEVDGGVTPETAVELADAGADRLVSGSYVFANGGPAKALAALDEAANPS